MNPLLDSDFLSALDENREREVYVKIIALNFKEEPIECIEGQVTSGSINIDGNSAVRRTCNLSLIAKELNINEFYWGIKTKIKIEIGLKNNIDNRYDDIIWFPQGCFVITAFNTSQGINNYTVSINAKDKMCLLNGDLGGSIPASVDFGVEEFYNKEKNITTYTKVPIRKIIQNALYTYGKELVHNIVINDLDEAAVELLEYKGEQPLYLLRNVDTDVFENFTLDGEIEAKKINDDTIIKLKDIPEDKYDNRVEIDPSLDNDPLEIYFPKRGKDFVYTISKLQKGEAAGYRATDLTYAGDLISSIGESLTSILDKIVKMLGEYEYFYNIEGQFVFQKKRIFVNTSWNNITKTLDESYVENAAYASSYSYFFGDGKLIQSFQNSPNLTNLRNDFSIWGERTTATGAKVSIHYRYAIDLIPQSYNKIKITEEDIKGHNAMYPNSKLNTQEEKEYNIDFWDWREIIYQMALDYYKYSQLENFLSKVAESNPQYPDGITGYEQYYTDLQGFWRQLYNPDPEEEEIENYDENNWHVNITRDPALLNFWFDFLDADNSDLGQYSVKMVGNRVKTVNDKSITSIYFKEVPNLIFTSPQEYARSEVRHWSGYTPVFIQSNLESLFRISGQGKSAKESLDEQLFNHSYCVENITVKSIPIYYLQPNTRIFIKDDYSKINGEYIVNKITIPLNYNGIMSISATKAPQRLY